MKSKLGLGFVASAVLLVATGTPVAAQNYFGQNQVQYNRFDWEILPTEHFLI